MYYSAIKKNDIANGTGVRVSLFVSGCDMHCPGCFNPETWNFYNGQQFTDDTVGEILEALKPDHIEGLSILGGEPLHIRNYAYVNWIASVVRKVYPGKSIWLYTGYKWEDVKHRGIMQYLDILVDGAFIEEQKDLKLKFRGSANQRIIDVQKSLSSGEVVLWEYHDRHYQQPDLIDYIRGHNDENHA